MHVPHRVGESSQQWNALPAPPALEADGSSGIEAGARYAGSGGPAEADTQRSRDTRPLGAGQGLDQTPIRFIRQGKDFKKQKWKLKNRQVTNRRTAA